MLIWEQGYMLYPKKASLKQIKAAKKTVFWFILLLYIDQFISLKRPTKDETLEYRYDTMWDYSCHHREKRKTSGMDGRSHLVHYPTSPNEVHQWQPAVLGSKK